MHARHLTASFLVSLSALLGATGARAEGLLLEGSKTSHPARAQVRAEVVEQVATTTAELEFDGAGASPSRFAFALPAGASVVGFAVQRDGAWEDAKIGDKDAITAGQVEASGGPSGVAEYLGDSSFAIDLPPLGQTQVKVRLTYIQLLPYEEGKVSYTYPLARAPWLSDRPTDATLTLRIESERAMVGYDAGAHDGLGSATSQGQGVSEFTYKLGGGPQQEPFVFTYELEHSDALYLQLMTHHERCDDDGFFMLVVEPPAQVSDGEVIPKYFSFVMDVSGSMEGTKLAQAKVGAQTGVKLLNGEDRFNAVVYSNSVRTLFSEPVPATEDNRNQAIAFFGKQLADGGTNINDALTTALGASVEEGFARVVVLLTDGQPTAGETDPFRIVQNVKKANTSGSRVYTFGVGDDVNKQLLSDLAVGNGGEAVFVHGNGAIEQALTKLLQKVAKPVLTDATIGFGAVNTSEVYPEGPHDLFAGSQLLVVGRYQGSGPAAGSLDGSLFGSPQHSDFSLDFPACDQGNGFLPRLWAKAKIDALLARMAADGHEDPAVVAEIEALSKKYGVQTPYTSYGVGSRPPVGGSSGSSAGSYSSPPSYGSGALDAGCQAAPAGAGSSLPLLGLVGLAAALGRRRRAQGSGCSSCGSEGQLSRGTVTTR